MWLYYKDTPAEEIETQNQGYGYKTKRDPIQVNTLKALAFVYGGIVDIHAFRVNQIQLMLAIIWEASGGPLLNDYPQTYESTKRWTFAQIEEYFNSLTRRYVAQRQLQVPNHAQPPNDNSRRLREYWCFVRYRQTAPGQDYVSKFTHPDVAAFAYMVDKLMHLIWLVRTFECSNMAIQVLSQRDAVRALCRRRGTYAYKFLNEAAHPVRDVGDPAYAQSLYWLADLFRYQMLSCYDKALLRALGLRIDPETIAAGAAGLKAVSYSCQIT